MPQLARFRPTLLAWSMVPWALSLVGASVKPSVSNELKGVHHGMIRYPLEERKV